MIPAALVPQVAQRFHELGDPMRLSIVACLHERGELSVGEVSEAVGTSMANTSQHLRRLKNAGIASARKEATRVLYRVSDPTIEQLCQVVCSTLDEGQVDPVTPG